MANLSFMLGVTINLGLSEGREAVLVGGWAFFIFAVGLILTSRLAARAAGPFSLDLLKHRYRRQFSRPLATSLITVGTVATGRDVFALVFALLIVAGAPMIATYLFAVSVTIWFLFVAAAAVLRQEGLPRERSA